MTTLVIVGSVAVIVAVLVLAWLAHPDPPTWVCTQCRAEFSQEAEARRHVVAAHSMAPRRLPLRWSTPRSPLSPPRGERR